MELDELVPQPGAGRCFESRLRPGLAEVTGSGRARLDAIARWLQDVAYADVEDAGLADRGAWVVRRNRIRAERFPSFGEEVVLRTFCSARGTLVAERRTSIEGPEARVEAVALWVHIDRETGAPARLGEEFERVYGESAGDRRARSRLRHPDPRAGAGGGRWCFRAADTDIAGHVNNAAHWAIVEEELWLQAEPSSADIQIEFRTPAQPGEVTLLRRGGSIWVLGEGGELHSSVIGVPEGRAD